MYDKLKNILRSNLTVKQLKNELSNLGLDIHAQNITKKDMLGLCKVHVHAYEHFHNLPRTFNYRCLSDKQYEILDWLIVNSLIKYFTFVHLISDDYSHLSQKSKFNWFEQALINKLIAKYSVAHVKKEYTQEEIYWILKALIPKLSIKNKFTIPDNSTIETKILQNTLLFLAIVDYLNPQEQHVVNFEKDLADIYLSLSKVNFNIDYATISELLNFGKPDIAELTYIHQNNIHLESTGYGSRNYYFSTLRKSLCSDGFTKEKYPNIIKLFLRLRHEFNKNNSIYRTNNIFNIELFYLLDCFLRDFPVVSKINLITELCSQVNNPESIYDIFYKLLLKEFNIPCNPNVSNDITDYLTETPNLIPILRNLDDYTVILSFLKYSSTHAISCLKYINDAKIQYMKGLGLTPKDIGTKLQNLPQMQKIYRHSHRCENNYSVHRNYYIVYLILKTKLNY